MRLVLALVVCLSASFVQAQSIDTVLLHEESFVQLVHPRSMLSSQLDRNGAPYLYGACMEAGLIIFDISDPTAPLAIDTLPTSAFGGENVGSLTQYGDLLYVPLGGPFNGTQHAGLAIVDVSDPTAPTIISQWDSAAWNHGSAIVRVIGDLAYLGAMQDGLIVLNVGDPAHIHFVSHYLPDVSWPGIVSYAPNARGMDIVGNTLFLAFDAGCLRAIDISDPTNLGEIGHYFNPQHPAGTAIAYNNLRVINGHAFIALDFCGVEVVDVTDPTNMQQVAWLNPWNCMGLSWFGSDGHTNELIAARNDSLLFVSGADSEVLIYDITQPASPQLKGGYIHANDSAATWGLDVRDSLLVINYIYNAGLPLQPYYSDIGGFQLFTWHADIALHVRDLSQDLSGFTLYPNPTDGRVIVRTDQRLIDARISVRDALGRELMLLPVNGQRTTIDLAPLSGGLYFVSIIDANGSLGTQRVIVR